MKKYSFYNNLWFIWLFLTAVYILTWRYSDNFLIGNRFIGIFVPFGYWNTAASISLAGLITFPLLFGSLFFAERIADKIKIPNQIHKIFFNLLWLFLLTMLVDYIIWGNLASFNVLLGKSSFPF